MKRFLMMCAVALAMVACGDVEPNIQKPDVLTVKQNGTVVYSDNEVVWRLVPSVAEVVPPLFTLYMDGTRFVEAMPLLDMEVLDMPNQHSNLEDYFLYEAESVVPSIKGNQMPLYTLTNFRCAVEYGEKMEVTFECKGYEVKYVKNL